MNLHFIFLVKESRMHDYAAEFEYVQRMATFFKDWIYVKFDVDYDVQCDMMTAARRSIIQRPDIHSLLQDHRQRGEDTYHFYLTYFRPLWTDCTCDGYHAENFGMVWWQKMPDASTVPYMAEKNCTTVSHEIAHELLRQRGHPRYVADVHDVWTEHFYSALPFEGYDAKHQRTRDSPVFLTIDTRTLV